MGKIFCIMGKSASGKDTIYKKLVKTETLPVSQVIPYTTRPMRAGEIQGESYHFVDDAAYEQLKNNHKIIESRTYETIYGPWHYFTADDGQIDLEKGDFLLIGTLEAYIQIRQYFGEKSVVPIYIEVEDGERLSRALMREKMQEQPRYEELCRRFLADAKDFSDGKLADAGVEKHYINTNLEKCYQIVYEDIMKSCTSKK